MLLVIEDPRVFQLFYIAEYKGNLGAEIVECDILGLHPQIFEHCLH